MDKVEIRENPLKQLFLTKEVEEKRGYLSPRSGKGKWAFTTDKQQGKLAKL
jgi:hypothetical protein